MIRWLTAALLLFLLTPIAAAQPSPYAWRIINDRWSAEDERGYGKFIAAIFAADCHTVVDCLAAPSNPLAKGDPPGLVFSADCADLVYMLRAYYAWKHGLPFGFVTEVEARNPNDTGDLRYTAGGNRALARAEIVRDGEADIRTVLSQIRDMVSTATFRIDPRIEHPVSQDFYSPALTRAALLPGSAIYNGDGHVVIVADVDDAGRIHFIDAHPDLSITRGIYAGQFQRSDPAIAAGFHAWRPLAVSDGRLAVASNAQIATYSLEQYFGPDAAADWHDADYSEGGRNVDFIEFIRRRLAKGDVVYDILDEAHLGFDGLCDDLADRARFVADSTARGYPRLPHPGRLEGVTSEDAYVWLAFSTPGRDRRLRTHAQHIADDLSRFIALYGDGAKSVRYKGKSLKGDLRKIFAAAEKRCAQRYINSDGAPVDLTLRDMLNRLADLSFDPYHCPERRWGATGRELSRCDEDGQKARWYAAEAPLRRVVRTDATPPNPTLEELEAAASILGDPPMPVDFDRIFDSAPDRPPGRRKR